MPFSPSTGQTGFAKIANEIKSDKINTALGFEAELLLPFNKNKWSVFAAPNYQQLKYEFSGKFLNNGMLIVNFDYKGIEIPFGVRHYFDLNEKNKIFVDAAYNFIIVLKKSEDRSFTGSVNPNLVGFSSSTSGISSAIRFGLGYKYNNKCSLSLNYYTDKEIMHSNIGGFSLVASYKLF